MNTEKQVNIFIVDDNKIFLLALKADIETTFRNKRIKIQSFETGEACMRKFEEEKAQVVILDYHLNSKFPDVANGINILDLIKKECNETNVIMLTGDDNIDIAIKSMKHGAADYVVKTETKFIKINYSLSNLFKTMEAKSEARTHKRIVMVSFLVIALFIGGVIAIQIFAPSLLQ